MDNINKAIVEASSRSNRLIFLNDISAASAQRRIEDVFVKHNITVNYLSYRNTKDKNLNIVLENCDVNTNHVFFMNEIEKNKIYELEDLIKSIAEKRKSDNFLIIFATASNTFFKEITSASYNHSFLSYKKIDCNIIGEVNPKRVKTKIINSINALNNKHPKYQISEECLDYAIELFGYETLEALLIIQDFLATVKLKKSITKELIYNNYLFGIL